MSNNEIIVAIDGPSASGKSTVARCAARELGFCYVDSGALYRGMTWKALREGIDVTDTERVIDLSRHVNLEFFVKDKVLMFTIDGEDPTDQLRSEPVREHVADVAAIPEIRMFLVKHLRETVRFGNIVMEGRDIGTVVFPASPFKFYLDADPEERARRRYEELARVESSTDVGKVLDSLRKRDKKDATRKTAPLQIALGARVIDSTAMSVDDVVRLVVAQVRAAGIRS